MTGAISPTQVATLVAGAGKPGYRELADAIRLATMDGRLALGRRLPSERALSQRLGVSRTTITSAYDALREQGFAESHQGSGTFTGTPGRRTRHDPTPTMWAPAARSPYLEWSHAAPAAPVPHLVQAYERALPQLARHVSGHGYEAYGIPELRAAVADSFTARGLATGPDQILITPGAQAAHMIVLGAMSRPGQRVLAEHPTYPHAIDAVSRHRMVLDSIDIHDGWEPGSWRSAVAAERPAFVYTVPDFHNPTGQVMADSTRAELAEAIKGPTVIVDEALSDMSLDGPRAAPMASFLPSAVTVGSISKVAWGGLRTGWIRAEPELVARFAGFRAALDAGVPIMEQLVVLELLGEIEELRRLRAAELRRKRDLLAAELHMHLPEWGFQLPAGGLSLWADLGAPVSSALTADMLQRGVRLTPGSRFAGPGWPGSLERRLRLPYTLDDEDLTRGVGILAESFRSLRLPPTTQQASVAFA